MKKLSAAGCRVLSGFMDPRRVGNDVLIASLTMTLAPVTPGERDELRSQVEGVDLPASSLAELSIKG